MSDRTPPPRRWYRSLYWRIAAGFIACLAVMLLAQVGLFVWLSSQREDALPPRLLTNLTRLLAEELGADAEREGADLAALARARFEDLGRPAAIVFPDGRIEAAGGATPPAALVAGVVRRLARGDQTGWGSAGGPGLARRRGFGARRGADDGDPLPGRMRPVPWAMAPIRVHGQVRAAVLVARGRPPGTVAREMAPWLALGLAALLVAGTAASSLAVFRPAHVRLRELEEAARRFGEGDHSARAPADGGDEVSAVARAFNRMAEEAAAREAALVAADRSRRQLLADVSHELRTPLTSIRGYAETLAMPAFQPSSPQGQQAVRVVGVEAQRLERLVDDLLDLARLDAGGAPLELGTVRVADLFERVRERHGPVAAAAQVALDTHVAADAAVVRGDAARLEQVLQNLTANALAHVAPGGHVRLDARRDGDAIVLGVEDDGVGIPEAHLPLVFDRFYKADASRAGRAGTGLGLSIVKAIVERHGGTVHVESTPGVRTRFDVHLPTSA